MTKSVDPLVWYQGGFEVLSPLRYHIDEILNEMEAHNRCCELVGLPPPLSQDKIGAARKVQAKCEMYFTSKG